MDFRDVYSVTAGGKAVKYILDQSGRRLWGADDTYVASGLYSPNIFNYYFRKGYYDLLIVGGGADTLINNGHYGNHGYPSSSGAGWRGRVYVAYDRLSTVKVGCATYVCAFSGNELYTSSNYIVELGSGAKAHSAFFNGTSSVLGIACEPGFTVQYGEKFFTGPPYLASIGGTVGMALEDGVTLVQTFNWINGSDAYTLYTSSGAVNTDSRRSTVWQWGQPTRNYFWYYNVARTTSGAAPFSSLGLQHGRGAYFNSIPSIPGGGAVTANGNSYGANAGMGLVIIGYRGLSI